MPNAALARDCVRRKASFFQDTTVVLSTRSLTWLLWAGVIAALLFQLGAAVLFEPDEGRNAEKAREILVLHDWVTPHENFHPVLDKPIFFYWLIALAYKLFGISEWAARLPSALAALGTLAVVYRFAQLRWGQWPALWSVLILLTSVEFFALARIVILDMSLAFFITLSLCSFFEAFHADQRRRRLLGCLFFYAALGAATLTKGLVGVAVPALVIVPYLLSTRRWAMLARMHLAPGALLYFAIVLSWYLPAEARNPGYLHYYLWEEHFGRFVTEEFDRGGPWYYYIGVVLVGFLPWSLMLPFIAGRNWKNVRARRLDDATLYVICWIVGPFMFFSLSSAKLPHYILPIFPPLALLTGATLARWHEAPERWRAALSLTWWGLFASAIFFILGWFFPPVLPRQIRAAIGGLGLLPWIFAAVSGAMLAYTARRRETGPRRLYALQAVGLGVFLAMAAQIMVRISPSRSAEPIAAAVSARLTPAAQVVFYDTYLAGVLLYLRTEEPFLLVTKDDKKQTFLGNFYALGSAGQSPLSASETILSFEQFHRYWQDAERPLMVIVKAKNLPRMARQIGEQPARVDAVGEYLLVTQP